MDKLFTFDNSYTRLPEHFYERILPTQVKAPRLIRFNHPLAHEMGGKTKNLSADELAQYFSGNTLIPGAEPIALAYAGHQFGHFVPQLGDGRANLLGEVVSPNGKRRDLQLKGSGQTRFSRRGDGRAALGPVIREYILSEALHRLGVPTSRSLAMVTTGENVFRETELPGGIVTRLASSHIRVGTFEYFAARRDQEALKILANYTLRRHYPETEKQANPYTSFLKEAVKSQAFLISKWMQIGFIHGVMNTDNVAVSGETIDYGPCAFMDEFDPSAVFSSIDHHGRYAFNRQAPIALENLGSLAGCLLFLIDDNQEKAVETARGALETFQPFFEEFWLDGMRTKLGFEQKTAGDFEIIKDYLELMRKTRADYTLAFRYLSLALKQAPRFLKQTFKNAEELDLWLARWQKRLIQENRPTEVIAENMNRVNPAFIPRNHRVEEAIQAAVQNRDFSKTNRLIDILENPYADQPEHALYMNPPKPGERITQTFCGT